MTCHDVQQQLYDFVDRALDDATRDAMHRHLTSCTPCCTMVTEISSLEDRLRTTWREEPAPPALWSRIQAALDRMDPPAVLKKKWGRVPPWRWSAAVAAVLVVALGIVLLRPVLMPPASLQARLLSVPVHDLHTFVASQRSLDLVSTDPQQLHRWFRDKVDFPPPLLPVQAGKAQLAGGRLCYFLDRRVASFMYTAGDRYLSLFVMPHAGLQLPVGTHVALNQARATVHAVQGYTHVIWSHTDLLYSLVSDLPPEQLLEMARMMEQTS